ncbi:hypothetical protein D9M70_591890 [compost metagenome]
MRQIEHQAGEVVQVREQLLRDVVRHPAGELAHDEQVVVELAGGIGRLLVEH